MGVSPTRASRQRSPVANPPASGEIRGVEARGGKPAGRNGNMNLCRVVKNSRKGPCGPSPDALGEGSSPGHGFWSSVCPESFGGLAGESPVGVMTKQPRSWWPAQGEIRPSKRHDEVVLDGERVIGPYDEESCRVVRITLRGQGQTGAESWLLGRRPWKVRRPWRCSTQEPVGVEGAE